MKSIVESAELSREPVNTKSKALCGKVVAVMMN
jgi:hypothetical protein